MTLSTKTDRWSTAPVIRTLESRDPGDEQPPEWVVFRLPEAMTVAVDGREMPFDDFAAHIKSERLIRMTTIDKFKKGQRVRVVRAVVDNDHDLLGRELVVDRIELAHGYVVAGDEHGKWWLYPDALDIIA